MDDGEQDSLHAVLHADHTVLVATTLATLLLAGSALICRSGRRLSTRQGFSLVPGASQADVEDKKHSAEDSAKNSARSKERRRRGKDPLKDILRSGKKLKMLTVSRDIDTGSSAATSAVSSPLPLNQISDSSHLDSGSQRSASVSTTSTSRSVSSGSSHIASAATAALGMTDIHPRSRDVEDIDALTAPTSIRKPAGAADADGEPLRDISEMPESSSSTADSPADKSSSGSTVLLSSSQGKPAYNNPWDWDGQGASAASSGADEPAYRKPPRFHSKSPFVSSPSSSSTTPLRPSAASASSSNDLTFPIPNAGAASTSGTPRRVPTPRTNSNSNSGGNTGRASPASGVSETSQLSTQTQLASLRGALEAARMREEKARGELERYAKDVEMMRWENGAWRRREAELQAQVHHLMHQLQTYAALFHAQAHNHPQMQNGSPAPGSPSSPPNGQYGGPVPNGYPSAQSPGPPYPAAPLPNGYPLSGGPSPAGGYPIPGMFSPPMLSPGQLQPLQPYFAYPMPPPPPSLPPPHQHQPQQPTLFSMLFPGAANMKGEGRGSASGSAKGSARGDGGGSAKGSESVSGSSVGSGSGSPDLVGSPSPAPGPSSVDRGRRRTRTQTAEARFGMGIVGASWEGEVGEGWVGVEHETGERPEYDGLEQYDHEHDHDREGEGDYDGDGYENEEGYGYEDDGGFSDVLADAILKRPESMRVRSRPKQRDRERPAVPAEFTFPSLSDFGPGVQQGGGGYKQRRDGSVGVQQEEADAGAGIEEMPVLPLALENLADPTPILHKGSSSQLDEESQS